MKTLLRTIPLLLVFAIVTGAFAGEATPLFQLDTKKTAETVILDEDAGIAVIGSKAELAVFRLGSGEQVLAVQDKFATDYFTIVLDGKYVVTTLDKGKLLRAYNLASGQVAWESEPPAKLKNLYGVYDSPAGLLLHIDNDLYCIDAATGKTLWTKADLNLAPQELRDAIYPVTGDFGVRLVALGAPMTKIVHVLDGATGNVLATHSWELGLAAKPVISIGNAGVAILHSEGVSGIDAASGKELWKVEGKLTGNDLLKKLKVGDTSYALFGFAESIAIINLNEGTLAYRSNGDMNLAIQNVKLVEGTLVVTGLRDQTKGNPDEINNNGGFALAYGVDVAAGKLAWGPVVLVNSAMNSLASTTKAIGKFGGLARMAQGDVAAGLGQMKEADDAARTPTTYVGFEGPAKIGDDVVYYVYAEDARVITSNSDSWSEGAGEGLVRINVATGEVVWRTGLTLFNAWEKPLKKVTDISEVWTLKSRDLAPKPAINGDVAYVPAGGTVVKVNLNSGEVLWTGADHELVTKVFVVGNRVAAIVGGGMMESRIDVRSGKVEAVGGEAKVNGVQVLDAANGNEVAFIEMKDAPATMLAQADEETDALYVANGETVQRIDLANGKIAWEQPLKKVTGKIDAKSGSIIMREEAWLTTGTTALGFVSAEETEIEVVTAEMALGAFWCKDNSVIVMGPDGPAKIGRDGSVVWQSEWKFDPEKTRVAPKPTKAGILSATKSGYQLISLKDGSVIWTAKADEEDGVAFDSELGTMILMGKKNVTAFKI